VKAVSGRELCRILERHGWTLQRISCSHHIYAKPGNTARIAVPVHANTSLKIGLQRHLMKLSGIAEAGL
jgi:predicted RNA binding protein YcfA (HicA-like mRNA interferase family)